MSLNLRLKVLWLKSNLGLAIDYSMEKNSNPVTSYYFWPKTEVWEQLRLELYSRPWVNETERVKLLNTAGQIMDLWKSSASLKREEVNLKYVTFVKVD